MRLNTLLLAPLASSALAAPCIPEGIAGWTSAISKSFSWFAGEQPIPEQLVVANVEEPSIWDTLKGRDEFSKLVKFVEKDDELVKLLSNKKNGLTFFAPNNEAIEKVLPPHKDNFGFMDDKEDRKRQFINEAVKYHLLPQEIDYALLGQNSTLATELHAHDGTIGGHRRRLRVESSVLPPWKVTINGYSVVTESDIRAVNGVIHKIDTPIFLPLDVMDALHLFPNEFSTTTTALLKVDLQNGYEFNSHWSKSRDGNEHNDRHGKGTPATTFFAPTNAAWNQLPKELVFFLFSPFGEHALRKLLQFHTIPSALIFSEWGREVKDSSLRTSGDNDDLSFEWDHHFNSGLSSQKLPVHARKWKNIVPGSKLYNFEVQAHGVPVKYFDGPAQNGVVHVLDDVLSPRQKEGVDKGQNDKDWMEYKDWFYDWVKNA